MTPQLAHFLGSQKFPPNAYASFANPALTIEESMANDMNPKPIEEMSDEDIDKFKKARKEKPYREALSPLLTEAERIGKAHGNKPVRRVLLDAAEVAPKSR